MPMISIKNIFLVSLLIFSNNVLSSSSAPVSASALGDFGIFGIAGSFLTIILLAIKNFKDK